MAEEPPDVLGSGKGNRCTNEDVGEAGDRVQISAVPRRLLQSLNLESSNQGSLRGT